MRSTLKAFVCAFVTALFGAAAFGGATVRASDQDAYNAGIAGAALRQASAQVITTPSGPGAIAACAKKVNGQLRLADEDGCNSSEVPVALTVGLQSPTESTRLLTIPPEAAFQFGGIFGGLLCPAGRTLVSGGFQILDSHVKIHDSFVGPAFGLPRVYFVQVLSDPLQAVPAGDMARMWVTCL